MDLYNTQYLHSTDIHIHGSHMLHPTLAILLFFLGAGMRLTFVVLGSVLTALG